ncbi:MAG: WecB/TagA/CpsF family glycosyltransferase [Muribaculaceae bacterium]|nr:WecB/TagA/CpsF family glycosyltransferase [Muribaculaceae bacterium]
MNAKEQAGILNYGAPLTQNKLSAKRFVDKISKTAGQYPDDIFSTPGKIYTCVNPYSYHLVRNNPELYRQMDGLFVDGFTMCLWIKLLWNRKIPRLSFDMSGMAVDLFNLLNDNTSEKSIYFLGTKQEILEQTVSQIRNSYPGINVKGYRNGYFNSAEERADAIQKIVDLNPHYTIIGLGSPMQEQFALDLRKAGYKGIAFTCGGFLHQTSSRINYYPKWINKLNLRAFYRLYKEKGMAARLWQVLVCFPAYFIYDSLKTR